MSNLLSIPCTAAFSLWHVCLSLCYPQQRASISNTHAPVHVCNHLSARTGDHLCGDRTWPFHLTATGREPSPAWSGGGISTDHFSCTFRTGLVLAPLRNLPHLAGSACCQCLKTSVAYVLLYVHAGSASTYLFDCTTAYILQYVHAGSASNLCWIATLSCLVMTSTMMALLAMLSMFDLAGEGRAAAGC